MQDSRPLSKQDDPELELYVRNGRTIVEIATIYGMDDDGAAYLRRNRPMLYEKAVANLASRDKPKT